MEAEYVVRCTLSWGEYANLRLVIRHPISGNDPTDKEDGLPGKDGGRCAKEFFLQCARIKSRR